MSTPKQLLSSFEAARFLHVHDSRVRQLAHEGVLPIYAETQGGRLLFEPSTVEQLRRERASKTA
jgi:excisionase family DNA binding protein